MQCEICGLQTEAWLWVRPIEGGPRRAIFLCERSRKEIDITSIEVRGLKEAPFLLGWDVFRPLWKDRI